MYKKTEKEAVSPVIAVILMVAITVVLAAVLFVMVQQYTEQGESIVVPLGVSTATGNATHWVLSITSNDADYNTTTSQLQKGGIAVSGYTTLTRQTTGNPGQVMTWYDNDLNWKVSPGDSISIEKPSGATGDYVFLMLTEGSKIIEKTVTA